MRISVCVATKNRTDMLHQFLWSLIRQEYEDWDLTIVDDSDVPVQWNQLGVYPRLFNEITRTGHDLRITVGPRVSRIGAAYQRGFGASEIQNPLFFRADDDSWLEPDYFTTLTDLMKDETVGASGGLFLHPGQEIQSFSLNDDRYRHATIEGLSDQINIQWHRHEQTDPIRVEHLTANILFNRKWLERIGGFEANLYRQHRDETQATWRLQVEGARLFVHPKAVAWHLRSVNGGARGHAPDVYINDHRTFMAQRRTMAPGIHVNLGHAIGDGFMATPMLHALRMMNPDRNIAVYAPWAHDVLKSNPDINEIAENPLDAQRTMRLEQSVYSWASAHNWDGHLAQAYCKMFNLPVPDDLRPRFHWSDEENEASQSAEIADDPYIVIAPWSTARTFDLYKVSGNKNWHEERWKNVVTWAQGKGFKVVQLRATEMEPLIESVDVDFLGRPLREAFSCIEKASLLVSVDTMAHHAAAAFGVPSVVLWGRSKPEHFGYRSNRIINLQGECPGIETADNMHDGGRASSAERPIVRNRPCIHGDQWAMDQEPCPIEGHPCMSQITEQSVFQAMEKLLAPRL